MNATSTEITSVGISCLDISRNNYRSKFQSIQQICRSLTGSMLNVVNNLLKYEYIISQPNVSVFPVVL